MRKDEDIFNRVVSHRRWLHRNPELSFQEYKTASYIEKELNSIGQWEVTRPTETSVMAVIRGEKAGKTVAFRADIDALPIEEQNTLEFKSENPGIMHACGHDGHTAMLLSAAELIAESRELIAGEIRLIFQHAEELPPGGAVEMVSAGVMDGVDEIFGLHLSSNYPTGKIGVKTGILTAATDKVSICINGKGGHSAMPDLCIDPVVIGAQTILALQTIVSRQVNPRDTVILSVCKVTAGVNYNVIPDSMELLCSVRTFNPDVRRKMPDLIKRTAESISASAGASVTVNYENGYDNVLNDESLTCEVEEYIVNTFGSDVLLNIDIQMPGEDFSEFTHHCPGCFVELGASNPEKGTNLPHHQGKYLLDEDALLTGTKYIAGLLLSRVSNQGKTEGK